MAGAKRVMGTKEYTNRTRTTVFEYEPDLFCPGCGSKSVWHDLDGDDYESGGAFVCVNCPATFNMMGPSECDQHDLQAVEQIRRSLV